MLRKMSLFIALLLTLNFLSPVLADGIADRGVEKHNEQKKPEEESNEIVKKLNSSVVGVVIYGGFNTFGITLWGLIIESNLFRDGEGKEIKSLISINNNNVTMQLITNTGTISFDFLIQEDIAVLVSASGVGQRLEPAEAAMILTSLREDLCSSKPTEEEIKKAELKARRMVAGDIGMVNAEYIELSQGPYNIPLNAKLEKVIQWAKENNLKYKDPLEKISVFETLKIYVNNREHSVENNFCDNLFKIEFDPSTELEKEEIGTIAVFFNQDSAGDWKSYACYVGYPINYLRISYEKLKILSEVLSKKYGGMEFIPIRTNDKGIGAEIHSLLGMNFNYETACVWKRNIVLFGRLSQDRNGSLLSTPYEPFYLLYYHPERAKEVISSYKEAVKSSEEKFNSEKKNSIKKMEKTF